MRIQALINGQIVTGYWNEKYYTSNKGKDYARIYIDNVEYHIKKDEFVYGDEKTNELERKLDIAKRLQEKLFKKYEDDKDLINYLKKQDIVFFTKHFALRLFQMEDRDLIRIVTIEPEKLSSLYNDYLDENLITFIKNFILGASRLPFAIKVVKLNDKTYYKVENGYYDKKVLLAAKPTYYCLDERQKTKVNIDRMNIKSEKLSIELSSLYNDYLDKNLITFIKNFMLKTGRLPTEIEVVKLNDKTYYEVDNTFYNEKVQIEAKSTFYYLDKNYIEQKRQKNTKEHKEPNNNKQEREVQFNYD